MSPSIANKFLLFLTLHSVCKDTHGHRWHHEPRNGHQSNTDDKAAASSPVPLLTFDGNPATTFQFVLQNDPVMGGESHSTFTVVGDDAVVGNNGDSSKFARWVGEVVDVPSLSAPGFCSVKTGHYLRSKFNDASGRTHLKLRVRSVTSNYPGFKVSFSSAFTLIPTFMSFKANFTVPSNNQADGWQWVDIPFSSFSNDWSPYTGNQKTRCKDDPKVCPKERDLKHIKQITLWAEGVSSEFKLDVLGIYAGFAEETEETNGAEATKETEHTEPKEEENSETEDTTSQPKTCSAAPQQNLRFNVSAFTAESVRLPFDPPENESLAEAVCCDPIYEGYAEPRGFFEWPNVDFFKRLESLPQPVTFYDSVCGIPIFIAPRERSFEEFKSDTIEHGWPSFRQAELVEGNVYIDDDGRIVRSRCGTRLGTYEPDDRPRYCLDVSCIAGHFDFPSPSMKHDTVHQGITRSIYVSYWKRAAAMVLRLQQPFLAMIGRV